MQQIQETVVKKENMKTVIFTEKARNDQVNIVNISILSLFNCM